MLPSLFDHPWQSTVLAFAAALFTLAMRRNRARVRYWLWFAASVKFLVPVSFLIALGSQLEGRRTPETRPSPVAIVMDDVSQPFTVAAPAVTRQTSRNPLPLFLLAVWACGFLGIAGSWWIGWRGIRSSVRAGTPMQLKLPIEVVCSPTFLEPGIFGVSRPVLLLPEGILDRLTRAQLEAVIEHELCHVRHRDNLIAAIHMMVETTVWFHPLVWWLGRKMV